uniref:C2H2-type domain-containing protein n=1 Tax=Caenorhabditis tropicalis TaxID=1561998 RepID=A0A1I7UBK6_9PELO
MLSKSIELISGHFPCLSCAQIFGHAASLRRHREVAHNDEHFCLLCNTQLSGKETVKMHMRDKHDLISIYTCGCCNFTFPSRIEFSSHLKAMKKNEGRKDENIIARTIETPGVLRDGSGSVSPTNTSSSSESSTPSTAPVSPVAATVPGDTTAVQEKKEHPQTGFNEISAVTPFGLYVLRENLNSSVKRLGKFGQFWMNLQQNNLVVQNPNLVDDYTAAELRRLLIDSVNEQVMRPCIGSTVSQLTYRCSDEENLLERRRQTLGAKDYERGATTSASGSSNGSSTRLRQLDVNITDQYYQDGPSDPLHSPNRAAQRVSALSHELHPHSPLANGDLLPQPVFFRALNKSISSPKSTKPHK